MARNDGMLYTGATSTSERRKAEAQRQAEKQRVQQQLLPVSEKVIGLIKTERENLGHKLLELIDQDVPDASALRTIEAVRLHRDFLDEFQVKILRLIQPSVRGRKQAEESDE